MNNVLIIYGRPYVAMGKPLCFTPEVSSSFFFLFFLAYSQPSQTACLPYFHTWCGLSVNLGCRSEMRCRRLAENIGRKNDAKIRHLPTIAHNIFATKAYIVSRKKTTF